MIPEKMQQVLKHEGVVSIATQGEDGPHLVNTWNSYIHITDDERILIPAGHMNKTEDNLEKNNHVLVTMGCREVVGFHGPGTGFLTKGTATLLKSGPEFESTKQKFPWARAVLVVTPESITQTL